MVGFFVSTHTPSPMSGQKFRSPQIPHYRTTHVTPSRVAHLQIELGAVPRGARCQMKPCSGAVTHETTTGYWCDEHYRETFETQPSQVKPRQLRVLSTAAGLVPLPASALPFPMRQVETSREPELHLPADSIDPRSAQAGVDWLRENPAPMGVHTTTEPDMPAALREQLQARLASNGRTGKLVW